MLSRVVGLEVDTTYLLDTVNEKTESTNSSKLLISDGCKLFSGGKFMANYHGFGSTTKRLHCWQGTVRPVDVDNSVHISVNKLRHFLHLGGIGKSALN